MKNPYLFLITGSEGFIGLSLVKYLLSMKNIYIVGLDIKKSSINHSNYTFVQGDISSITICEKVVDILKKKKLEFSILHLAAQTSAQVSMENPILDINTNLIGLLNLISIIKNKFIEPDLFMLFSSMAVYGNSKNNTPDSEFKENTLPKPNSIYGYTKLISERILELSGLKYIPIRLFNIFGPGQDMDNNKQGMVSIYLSDLLKTGNINVKGSLKRTRDFVFIDDLIKIVFKIIQVNLQNDYISSEPINISTGICHSVEELVNNLIAIYKKRYNRNAKIILQDSTPGDMEFSKGNNQYLKSIIKDLKFTEFKSGLEIMFDWADSLKL